MADFARFLPLSNRSHEGEDEISTDWRGLIAAVVVEASRLVASAPIGEREVLTRSFFATAHIERGASAPDNDPTLELSAAADAIRAGRRRNVRHLVHATRALLELASATATTPIIDPLTTGAVALWAATSAPFARRVVLEGHTLRATDANWEFGRGPVLEGRAIDIVAFGLGVSEIPPVPPKRVTD